MTRIAAGMLDVAYEDHGDAAGWPAVLLHGFPYDPRCYDEVVPILVGAGARVILPWLRGYGATRFLDPAALRSGEQAALGADLLALLDALAIPRAVLAGYDWGGRAACIVAALWPERVQALVSQNGYNIQDIARASEPAEPEDEYRYWYQWYFQGARGAEGLARHRRELCRLLWRLWSPDWEFDEATYDRSAASFDNPDFVAVVLHSYRHRYGMVPGDPAVATIEARLAAKPPITVPTVTLDGASDGVMPRGGSAHHARHFTGPHLHRVIARGGHNLPQEKPEEFARAILDAVALGGRG